MPISLKRASEAPARSDGKRVLVDRLWPRGRSKQGLQLHLWLRDIAPSSELRRWFAHDPKKWPQLRQRYFAELDGNVAVRTLRELLAQHRVTLLFAAADHEHNNAVALREYLLR